MNLFFDVPKVLQVGILAHWLEPVDAAYLDSATTSHKYRNELLDLLSSPECILGSINFTCMEAKSWVILRKVRLAKVRVNNEYLDPYKDWTMWEKLTQAIGPTIKSLEINDADYPYYLHSIVGVDPSNNLKYLFTQNCRSLETLGLLNGKSHLNISALIRTNQDSLANIKLSRCYGISATLMETIYRVPGLKKVELVDNCSYSENMSEFFTEMNTSCTSLVMPGTIYRGLPSARMATQLPNLRVLSISLGSIQDLVQISALCPLIEHAHTDLIEEIYPEHALCIAQNWQHIRELSFQFCDGSCADSVMVLLICKCTTLTRFCLSNPWNMVIHLSPAAQINTQGLMSHLQELTVNTLHKDTLYTIVRMCPHLHTLSFRCEHDMDVGYLRRHHCSGQDSLHLINNSSIKMLRLINCCNVRNQDLLPLRSIEKLVLRSVGTRVNLSAQGIVAFVLQCPTLHTLHIHNCPGIDYTVVLKVLQVATQLRDFSFTASHTSATNPALAMLRKVVMQLYPQLHSFQISC